MQTNVYRTALTGGKIVEIQLPTAMIPKDFELLSRYVDLLIEADGWTGLNEFTAMDWCNLRTVLNMRARFSPAASADDGSGEAT